MRVFQHNRLLKIDSPLGEDGLILTRLSGRESLSENFQFKLSVLTDDFEAIDALLGQCISVEIYHQSAARYIHGMINRITFKGGRYAGYTLFELNLVPQLWTLTQASNCRIFQKQSVLDIVNQLCLAHKIACFDQSKLRKSYQAIEYCVQYNETDFDFMRRLFSQSGMFFYFSMQKNSHQAILVDDVLSLPVLNSPVTRQALSAQKKSLYTWCETHEVVAKHVALIADNVDLPSKPFVVNKPEDEAHDEQMVYPGAFNSPSAGGHQYQQYQNLISQQALNIQMHGTYEQFHAGMCFHLDQARLRTFYITDIEHFAEDNSHFTQQALPRQTAAQFYHNQCVCLPINNPCHQADFQVARALVACQTATVVSDLSSPMLVNQKARIKVQFHWDRYGGYHAGSSCWLSCLQLQAGCQWGAQFLPRVGQEVLVGFEHGALSKPFVMGAVYNTDHMPLYPLPNHQYKTVLVTRALGSPSNTQCHRLCFNDQPAGEAIELYSYSDFFVYAESEIISVNHNVTVHYQNRHCRENIGRKKMIVASQKITLQSENGRIEIHPQSIQLLGDVVECMN